MTQFRADEGLAFMLQYENVAWYDAGEVRILDRRIYPAKIEFVRCKTHVEVMQAIRDMVTQSAGPYASPNTTYTDNFWSGIYDGIGACNIAIYQRLIKCRSKQKKLVMQKWLKLTSYVLYIILMR